ncbi:hypothetical protein [Tenggerimyces flavus]|uniref:Uncharacterized protein n=1 Tax=Tenggerimyces flavus TaxID=1708749 RepID=A0ABV7Y4K4_9ACTN|nr:hypothetical protein [Tenggerimyces flavus]MBM7790102.1 hypothetical protein [Tenggerimyces flavus]
MTMLPDHSPGDGDIRQLLEHTVTGEPGTSPPVQDDLARGRRALRRRNGAVIAGAVAGIGLVAAGIAYVPNLVGLASGPGIAGNPTATMYVEPTPPPSPTSTSPTDAPDAGDGCLDEPCSSFGDVLIDRLGTAHFKEVSVMGGIGGEAAWQEVAWSTWTAGKAKGTVVAAVDEFKDTEAYIDDGPDGKPCAVRSVNVAHDPAFGWTTCSTERLPDGGTLRVAEGGDAYAPARAATLITKGGTVVSIAVSTAYFDRDSGNSEPSDPDFPPKLSELPLTAEQLEASSPTRGCSRSTSVLSGRRVVYLLMVRQ